MTDSRGPGTPDRPTAAEVSALLGALCDEVISPTEMARLNELLATDAGVRRSYRELIGLHSALQFTYQVPHEELPPPLADTETTRGLPLASWLGPLSGNAWVSMFTVAVVVVAVVCLGWLFWPPRGERPMADGTDANSSATKSDGVVACLHYTEECRWGDGSGDLASGATLRRGQQIELIEGVASVGYENGVNLVLEGPAHLTIDSAASATLARGKCFASVSPAGSGFRLRTPTAEVIDHGTEFGVMASETGVSEIGVFKGQVECFALDSSGACVDRMQLIEGQATRVGGADVQPLPDLAALSCSFARGIKGPEGVRAYWRFEEDTPSPADDGLATQIGLIGDASGKGNRLNYWPGGKGGIGAYRCGDDVPPGTMFREGYGGGLRSFDNGALRASAAGILSSGAQLGTAEAVAGGFTVEGFFKTHGDVSASRPMTLLYQGEKYYTYLIGLNKRGKGIFSFFIHGHVGSNITLLDVSLSDKNFADGTWHYFAARYEKPADGTAGRMSLVVMDEDGRKHSGAAAMPEGFQISCSSRLFLLGRQQYYLNEEPKAHFDGLMDEIRIAGRALRDDELLGRLSVEP